MNGVRIPTGMARTIAVRWPSARTRLATGWLLAALAFGMGPAHAQFDNDNPMRMTPLPQPQVRPRPAAPPFPPSGVLPQPGRPPGAPPATPSGPSAAPRPGVPASVPLPDGPPPAYERDLTRLSEVLGALSVLRDVCAQDGEAIRTRMQALLDAEAPPGPRRERLAGAYNKAARGYGLTHVRCSETSRAAMERFLTEAAALTRAIANRFGG